MSNLIGLPLHPIAVHFPIAISIICPIIFLVVLIGITRFRWPLKAWVVPVIFQMFLFVSLLVSKELGEQDEDRVETVIEKALIHEHEEWAERLIWSQGIALVISGVALVFPGRIRIKKATFAVSLVGAVLAGFAGHSGGTLVYKFNAGKAYLYK